MNLSEINDLKQSPLWGKYMESLGWKSHFLSNGSLVVSIKTVLGTIFKIQHPKFVTAKIMAEIEELAGRQRALIVKLEPFFESDVPEIRKHGFVDSPNPQCVPSTMYLDLHKSEEELWAGVSHSARYAISRGRREGARVEFIKKPSGAVVEDFYKLCRDTGRLKKFYVQPLKELTTRIDLFGDDAHLGLVYDSKNNLISGKLYLGTPNNLVLYLVGGTSGIGRKEKGGFVLMWDSILYLKKQGYSVLDLEGVDDARFPFYTKGWGGFSHFKERFGGEVVRFPPPMIKYYNPIFNLLSKISIFRL